jgi:hypothetical protein
MASQQPTKVTEPRKGAFRDQAVPVPAHFAAILMQSLRTILPLQRNQLDPLFLHFGLAADQLGLKVPSKKLSSHFNRPSLSVGQK